MRECFEACFEYWIAVWHNPARKVSLETTKKCLQNQLRFNTKISILLFQNNLLIMKHQRISKRDGDILMLQHFFDFSQFFVVFLMYFIFFTELMFSNWFFVTSRFDLNFLSTNKCLQNQPKNIKKLLFCCLKNNSFDNTMWVFY